jgi:AbrB family looped-hinge helix DNA binding protein
MLMAKVTSKGQITIPKQVRDKLGVQPGEGIGFEEKDGIFIIKKAVKKSPFDKWIGKLKKLKGEKSDAVIDELRGK